ncbi:MAG TPA: pseudouridine synthase [Planctomycetota bacterium]|nr:pseudouridine synthase [Planctomycetota bacterium]
MRSNPEENNPESLEIPILHLDESFVAVSKPGGLLVHRTGESRDTVFLLQELGARLGRFLYPVHRLDRAASGVIALAFSGDDARLLQAALAAEETRKEYLVLARGSTPEAWEVDRPLTSDAGVPRPSRTSFLRLAEMSGLSLLRAVIFTGRRHQIRRHLAGCAHQVLGDTTYGKGRINRSFRESYGLPRLFLHAARLEVPHPRTGAMVTIAARLPQDLRAFLERLPDCPRELVDTL